MALAPRLAKGKLFYGWYIVILSFFVGIISSGFNAYAPSVLMKPISQELGITRTVFSLVITVSRLVTGIFTPFIGPALDKRGARPFLISGAIILGAGFMGLGLMHSVWHFAALQMVISVGLIGSGIMVANVAVINWFVRKRGRALAISTAGLAGGNIIITPLTAFLVGAMGWRQATLVLGLMVWVVVIIPSLLIMKRRPEDMGLHPDGEAPRAAAGRASSPVTSIESEARWTRSEATHTTTLWLVIAAFSLNVFGTGSLMLHLHSFLTDSGLSAQFAGVLIATVGTSDVIFKMPWGFAMERWHAKWGSLVGFLASAVAVTLLLLSGGQVWIFFVALVFQGFSFSGTTIVQDAIYGTYYGRPSQGTVRSIAMPFAMFSSAGGAVLAGFIRDQTGSYLPAFMLVVVMNLVAAGLIVLTRAPKRPVSIPARANL